MRLRPHKGERTPIRDGGSALLDGGEGWSGLPPLPREGPEVGLLLPQQCPVAGLPCGLVGLRHDVLTPIHTSCCPGCGQDIQKEQECEGCSSHRLSCSFYCSSNHSLID